MVVQFLRNNKYSAILILVLRLYVGYEWITSGYEKLTGGFDASGFLKGGIAKATGAHPAVQAWWASFLTHFALPNVGLFNFLIPWGELLVGLGLIIGFLPKTAVFFAMVMNFAYLFSGTVSTNPQLVILSMFILLAGANAGKWGVDGLLNHYNIHIFPKFPSAPNTPHSDGTKRVA
ncbi:DoxX family protein [Ectobacillus sp. sgz5001026]|uniref:DoxX family protein n=1 Tax=Ectobacillus sp. sgz5001026 TaxID=3242473 RepID=UPI0036D3896F